MRQPRALGLATLALLGATGCSAGAFRKHEAALHRRAVYELRCPWDAVQVRAKSDRTALAEGCGRRAGFFWDRNQWVLETGPEPAGDGGTLGDGGASRDAGGSTPPDGG